MKNKPSLGSNVRLAMEHPKLPRKQYLSIYFPKKHLQNTLQASSSIYRAFASSNPSILLVLSIFIFTQYEFFFLFFLPFFFSSYISHIARGGVSRRIVFLFPPRVSAFRSRQNHHQPFSQILSASRLYSSSLAIFSPLFLP